MRKQVGDSYFFEPAGPSLPSAQNSPYGKVACIGDWGKLALNPFSTALETLKKIHNLEAKMIFFLNDLFC